MTSLDIVTKLLRGGFSIREAADIIIWLGELYKYNPVDALMQLGEVAPMLEEESLWVPQPWYGELVYLRNRLKEDKKPGTKSTYRGLTVG